MKIEFLLSYIFFSGLSFAQSYQECLDSLYSENYGTKIFAIECINDFKPDGAVDVLIELMEEQQPFLQIQFLNALYSLEYENVETEAYELISRADDFDDDPEYPWDPLDAKVFATAILVYKGDYTTIDYVFDMLSQNSEDALSFRLLPYIMDNVPSFEQEAKNILITKLDDVDEYFRYYALLHLADKYGEEMNSELIDKFVNDSDLPTRKLALEYLFINNYSELNSLLKQQLELEQEPSLRIDIADSLLQKFGEPSDLKAVKDYQPNEPDETARSLMSYSIDEFIPPKPASLNLLGKVTKLISYVSEMYTYQWIANTQTRDYYITKLNLLKSQIESGRYQDACKTVNNDLLARIETDLAASNITTEGYKFLHYYCVYIKEDFPQGLQHCP